MKEAVFLLAKKRERHYNLRMRRIVLIIEYDGTNYVGWQIQPNGISVQETAAKALARLTGESLTLHASGRTDSGVHARAQVAHFDTESRIPADKFAFALNTFLPPDIRIKASFELPGEGENEFHSRFSVKKKHYRYTVLNSTHDCCFTRNYALHIHAPLDLDRLNAAAALFLGEHDFKAFKASREQGGNDGADHLSFTLDKGRELPLLRRCRQRISLQYGPNHGRHDAQGRYGI